MSRNMDRLLMRLARCGTNQLEEEAAKLKSSHWQELEQKATALACRLFFIAEYADRRGAAGCGDHGHYEAVSKANRKYKKARKLAGFSIP